MIRGTWRTTDIHLEPHVVYRIYDAADRLLYVGVTVDFDARLQNHKSTAGWFPQYDRHELAWYPDRWQAETAEITAIRAEHPVYNARHNQPSAPQVPTTRITLDLDQEAYTALNQWLGTAAAEAGAPVSKARALRAMIKAVALDKSIGVVVIDLLRRD